MEIYREKRKDLHMMVIHLVKAYETGPRKVLWWVRKKIEIHIKYIKEIRTCIKELSLA